MKRRELVLGLGYVLATWRTAARASAQQPGRVYRVGSLFSAPRDAPHHLALQAKLWRAGFVEGENLSIDEFGFQLSGAQFDRHAAELVSARVDVIMADGDAAVEAAQRAIERSLPSHRDIDPARVMRPRFAEPTRASSPSGLHQRAGHMTASDNCSTRNKISCGAGAIHT